MAQLWGEPLENQEILWCESGLCHSVFFFRTRECKPDGLDLSKNLSAVFLYSTGTLAHRTLHASVLVNRYVLLFFNQHKSQTSGVVLAGIETQASSLELFGYKSADMALGVKR